MNDYKELSEELRRKGLQNGSVLGWHSGLIDNAADAIEQLAKERDAAIADLRGFCGVCKFARNLSDNPFEDSKEECFCCKGDKWEWRGVQEVEHEAD